LAQIQGNGKLFLIVSSLLLLTLVTYSGSSLEKGQAASDTHIVAAGDWHCTLDAAKTVSVAKSLNPQLILGLGDYSDTETEACWVNLIKPVDAITKIAFGNHDDEYDNLANSYLNHYGLTKQFYSYNIKNVHVLTMATEEDFKVGSEQYNFVLNDLRSSASNPDIKWIVATMHTPFYTSPNECNAAGCEGDEELRDIYHPLFDKYGVDVVLQAHVRNYERSFPLVFNQESSSKPTITSTNKQEYKNPNGVIFAIVGTGGGELKHGLEGTSPFMAFQQDIKFGILDMHFSDNTLDAKFVAIDGSTMDHFSLSKTAKKKVIERISEDTFGDTNIRAVSDKDTTDAIPLAGQVAQDGKPSITFKFEDATAANTNTNPLSQDGKPSITFKFEDATAANTITNLLGGQEVQEVKPAVSTKLDDSDNSRTDDKPASLSQENAGSDDKDKAMSFASNDNAGKSNTAGLLRTTGGNNDMSDEDSDSTARTINTNVMDPFASLN